MEKASRCKTVAHLLNAMLYELSYLNDRDFYFRPCNDLSIVNLNNVHWAARFHSSHSNLHKNVHIRSRAISYNARDICSKSNIKFLYAPETVWCTNFAVTLAEITPNFLAIRCSLPTKLQLHFLLYFTFSII